MPPFDMNSFRRTVALKMEEAGGAALSVAVSNRKALLYSEGFVYGHTGTLLPYRSAMFFERSREICVSVMVNTNTPLLRDELVETLLASF